MMFFIFFCDITLRNYEIEREDLQRKLESSSVEIYAFWMIYDNIFCWSKM